MERETITYKGKKYHRYPKSEKRDKRVYFHRHDSYQSPKSLHQQIWIDNFGEIPKGFVVHHKDGNPFNNKISNLELLSNVEHSRQHTKMLFKRPGYYEIAVANLKLGRKKADAWHRGEEHRKLAKKWAKKSWKNKKTYSKKCILLECQKTYQTYFPTRSKFCSRKCKERARCRPCL